MPTCMSPTVRNGSGETASSPGGFLVFGIVAWFVFGAALSDFYPEYATLGAQAGLVGGVVVGAVTGFGVSRASKIPGTD